MIFSDKNFTNSETKLYIDKHFTLKQNYISKKKTYKFKNTITVKKLDVQIQKHKQKSQ